MNWNVRLFNTINQLVGRNHWLDAFGRAGAEWVVVAMLGWYGASDFIANGPDRRAIFLPILFLGCAWVLGWIINVLIGLIVKEPRPHVNLPQSKLLFTPLMSWKSFPSDHAMSAWLIFFMAVLFHLPWAGALLPLAIWVSWGRIFAGAHYPFDIVGGAAVAGLAAVIAWYVKIMMF